jgi:sulfate adenylyltransferase subunit 2
MDIWQYIHLEGVPIPDLYLSHERDVVRRSGILLAKTDYIQLLDGEVVSRQRVRFRTIGDATCTGAFVSDASSVAEIIQETAAARVTERGGRSDDRRSEAAMEDRKREGYF